MPRLLPPCSALIFVLLGAACAERTPAGDPAVRSGAAPVTDAMLRNPDPADWLMYSRTYDAQRFSPLDEINRANVGSLALAWSKPLATGPLEIIPLVHEGVMYLTTPGSRDGVRKTAMTSRTTDRRSAQAASH
jgi:glucose dehydrogenase